MLTILFLCHSVYSDSTDTGNSRDNTAVFIFAIIFVIVFLIILVRFRITAGIQLYVPEFHEETTLKDKHKNLYEQIEYRVAPFDYEEREKRPRHRGQARPLRKRRPAAYKGTEIALSARARQIEKSLSRFIIPESQLLNIKPLASGGFADVYTCDWNDTKVALKKMKPSRPPSELESFLLEMELMSKLRFPHLVGLIGCSFQPYYIVMPFLSRGTLHELLQDQRTPITWKHIRQFALQTAKALLYMHSMKPPMTHRDIKSGNVLVDHDWTLKMTDFGLSKPEDPDPDKFEAPKVIVGTPQWTAPEIFRRRPYKRSADVYRFVLFPHIISIILDSYAIMMWEMISRRVPYAGMAQQAILTHVMNKKRPDMSKVCIQVDKEYISLMESAWEDAPESRPSMKDIIIKLNAMPLELST